MYNPAEKHRTGTPIAIAIAILLATSVLPAPLVLDVNDPQGVPFALHSTVGSVSSSLHVLF